MEIWTRLTRLPAHVVNGIVVAIGAALALTVVEYFLEVRGLHLVPQEEYGVLSYGSAEPATGPPLMVPR